MTLSKVEFFGFQCRFHQESGWPTCISRMQPMYMLTGIPKKDKKRCLSSSTLIDQHDDFVASPWQSFFHSKSRGWSWWSFKCLAWPRDSKGRIWICATFEMEDIKGTLMWKVLRHISFMLFYFSLFPVWDGGTHGVCWAKQNFYKLRTFLSLSLSSG
jgi:hypothetical protein